MYTGMHPTEKDAFLQRLRYTPMVAQTMSRIVKFERVLGLEENAVRFPKQPDNLKTTYQVIYKCGFLISLVSVTIS